MKKFINNTIHSQKVFYRYFRKKGFKRFLKENILQSDGSNEVKAKSVALGIFIGLSPFWGFHSFLAISLSIYFRMNKMLTFMASQITFPPLIPLIIFASMAVGAPFVAMKTKLEDQAFNFDLIKENIIQYLIGSFILATTTAVICGLATYILLEKFNSKKTDRK